MSIRNNIIMGGSMHDVQDMANAVDSYENALPFHQANTTHALRFKHHMVQLLKQYEAQIRMMKWEQGRRLAEVQARLEELQMVHHASRTMLNSANQRLRVERRITARLTNANANRRGGQARPLNLAGPRPSDTAIGRAFQNASVTPPRVRGAAAAWGPGRGPRRRRRQRPRRNSLADSMVEDLDAATSE